jgi:myotubularin-related protein 6/7/8
MVGLTQNRSIQDEKLIEAIFQSHWAPESRASTSPIYGATATNLIIDARPTTNAVANTAKGAGTENMDHYRESKKVYLGIDHIHTMRESLAKVVEALREADSLVANISSDLSAQLGSLSVLDRQALRRSGWLRHISTILGGTLSITRNVHINSSHVLVHCSDGWDRTSQLSSLSQICLDPFYRTVQGFEILVEKDWLSFGHKFLDRCGHLSSEKFFVSPTEFPVSGGADAAQAFIASVQNRFASQSHVKETSPVFHQFLESVRQIQRQFPDRFEFNERFLRRLYYHLYSCQFGTFLFNTEHERRLGDGSGPPPSERTISVWDLFNTPAEMEQNLNPSYNPALDDTSSRAPGADMGVLLPNPKDVRFWNELYGKTDEEMNGRLVVAQIKGVDVLGSVEGFDDDPAQLAPPSPSISTAPTPELTLNRGPLPFQSQAPLTGSPRASSPLTLDSIPRSPMRKDSLSPFTPSSSSHNVSPYLNAPGTGSIRPPSPNVNRAKTPDFFAPGGVSSGMKSVWGKLSLNASAAFSVMQEAYAGVAKDFAKGSEMGQERYSELQPRTDFDDWAETPTASQGKINPPYLTATNPWATSKPRSATIPSLLDENPWSLTASPIAKGDLSSSLPLDPTVAHPASIPSPAASSLHREMAEMNIGNVPEAKDVPSGSSEDNKDPLGVGLV